MTLITMANIDTLLNTNKDAQFIDIRDYEELKEDGYIAGFKLIPLYSYLVKNGIITLPKEQHFSIDIVKDKNAFTDIFDKTKPIYLMCRAGRRSGFMKVLLEALGYDAVYNVGGIIEYQGNYKQYPQMTY